MPLLLLLLLTLACLYDSWPPPWDWVGGPEWSALYTWVGVAVAVVSAVLLSWRVRGKLARFPHRRESLLVRYQSWRFYHQIGLFLVYLLALYVFKWGWALESWGLTVAGPEPGVMVLLPGAELLVLAPLLVGLILSWCCFYDADRAFHDTPPPADLNHAFQDGALIAEAPRGPFWSRWAHLSFHLRHNLALVCLPVLLIVIIKGAGRFIPDNNGLWQQLASYAGMAATGAVFIAMPWVLRVVFRLKPLPEGPLRTRLLETARRLNFRCSDVLLWETKSHVANAMVAGVVPWLRYVVLTDRLVSDLTTEEIEAVFGHEVGHIKHHHMLYYLGFLLASVAMLWAGFLLFQDSFKDWSFVQEHYDLAVLPFVCAVGVYLFVVFGYLSRRCERQADLFGCRTVSCLRPDCGAHHGDAELAPGGCALCPTGIHTFMDALEKVGQLNGISRDRPGWLQSWQHSTIARRVAFLSQVLADQRVEKQFQRRVVMVKWGLMLGVSAVLLTLMLTQFTFISRAGF